MVALKNLAPSKNLAPTYPSENSAPLPNSKPPSAFTFTFRDLLGLLLSLLIELAFFIELALQDYFIQKQI